MKFKNWKKLSSEQRSWELYKQAEQVKKFSEKEADFESFLIGVLITAFVFSCWAIFVGLIKS